MQWYYADQGERKGPIEESALDELVLAGVVRDDTPVWREGMVDWQTHRSVRGSASAPAVPSPAAGETRHCAECGRPFPAEELVAIGAASVCATCKPVYLQKLREGGARAVGSWRYAGFWIRFLAVLVDGLLLGVVSLLIRIPFGVALFAPTVTRNPGALAAFVGASLVLTLVSYVIAACYEIFFINQRGATIGKMIFGLKVVRADGSPLSLGLSTGRYFAARWLNLFTFTIGYIIAAFDDQKRALHDRICETRVIYSR